MNVLIRKCGFLLLLDVFTFCGQTAEWIAGPYELPAETNVAAFFRDSRNSVVARSFRVRDCVVSQAVWRVASPGMRDLLVNGRRVCETALAPWTPFDHRVLEESYDVTARLHCGVENEIRVELGNGWWNPLPLKMWGVYNLRDALATGTPCVRATLDVIYEDGVRETVETDAEWMAGEGTLLRNSIYLGVREDSRLNVDLSSRARVVTGPRGLVEPADDFPKTIVYDRLRPLSVAALGAGRWLVDFGTNVAGTIRFRLRNVPAGREVRFRQGEILNDDGSVNVMSAVCGQVKDPTVGPLYAVAEQCDTWISSGMSEAVFEPRMTFHVGRYVQVEGLDHAPDPADCELLAWSADVPAAAHFECSDERLNRIHEMCRRTFRANLQSVQSDCPGREKFGYGGDIAATAESLRCNWGMRGFYRKVVRDFLDEAKEHGLFTETAPYVGIGLSSVVPPGETGGWCSGPIGWAVGVPVMLDVLVRYDGDLDIVREAYPALVRFIDIVIARYPDDDIPPCLGDWVAEQKANEKLTALAHWHEFLEKTARFARLLGKPEDSDRFQTHADRVRESFCKRYVLGNVGYDGLGRVGDGKQGEQLFALYHGLLDDEDAMSALDWLKDDLKSRGCAANVGLFGTQYLFETLSSHGYPDLAGQVVLHEGYPGYLFMLERGATTLWEVWHCSNGLESHCHPMLGSVDQWFMRYVLGIRVCEDAVGCDKVVIDPHPVCGLTSASGWLDTPKGRIVVSWKVVNGRILVEKDVPPGVMDLNDIALRTKSAECRVSLLGARVKSLSLAGEEVLWSTDAVVHADGKWRHGGMPLCWPWFGWRDVVAGKARIHGFANTRKFTLKSKIETENSAELVLGLRTGSYDLEYRLTLGDGLSVVCRTTNVGTNAVPYGMAFHPYFRIGERNRTVVLGSGGISVCDLAKEPIDHNLANDQGGFRYSVEDPASARRILLRSFEATGCTIWNCCATWPTCGYPLIDAFSPEDWRHYVSVEPVFAVPDLKLEPGKTAVADFQIGCVARTKGKDVEK